MFDLYIRPTIVNMTDTLKGLLRLNQIPEIRHQLANQALQSFNKFSNVDLSEVPNKAIDDCQLILSKFDLSLNRLYSNISANVTAPLLLKGAHILMTQHFRLSRDVLAAKATRMDKLQSGFSYMVAASKRLLDLYNLLKANKAT